MIESSSADLSTEQLEKLKYESLIKFSNISFHFDKMRKAFEKEGYNSESYIKAHNNISNEMLGIRFTAKSIEKLCDTLRNQINQVTQIEKQILEIVVNKCGMPRLHFIKVFPENEINLNWVDNETKIQHDYNLILCRNIPSIKELQQN